jgi:hypothetical protein
MHRYTSLVMLLLASANAGAFTAAELAAKNVAAKGGAEQLAAVHALRLSGKLRLHGGALELGFIALLERPGSIRYEAALQGLTRVQAYDGHEAWQINPFQGRKDPERLSADDATELAESAADFLGALVDYEAKGYKLDYLGTEDIDGTTAHKLRVTRPSGNLTYVYLDPEYFLEIRTIDRRIRRGVPEETVTDYGDYEKVAGVFFALAQESGAKDSSERRRLQVEKAEANLGLDAALFHFPAPAGAAQH